MTQPTEVQVVVKCSPAFVPLRAGIHGLAKPNQTAVHGIDVSGLSGVRFPAGGAFGSLAKSSSRVSFCVAYSGLRRQITTWRWLSDFPDAYGIRQKKRWIADALGALGNSDYSSNSHRLWQSADIFLQSYRHTLDLPVLDRHGSALFRGCFDFIRKTACLPKPSLFHLWS